VDRFVWQQNDTSRISLRANRPQLTPNGLPGRLAARRHGADTGKDDASRARMLPSMASVLIPDRPDRGRNPVGLR
jgi:hypothetical protein